MCRPDDYDVRYQINPWMDTARVPDKELSRQQFQVLHHTLIRLGAWIEYVIQGQNMPDMVFTANGGLVYGNKVILPRFRYPERAVEEPLFKAWFRDNGYEILELKTGYFEGEGDALFADGLLIGGYGFRSDKQVYEEIKYLFNLPELMVLGLTDPRFYHLDTCFCVLKNRQVMIFPGAFSPADLQAIENRFDVIAINEEDARKFACNSVLLGNDVVMPAGCTQTMAALEARGYSVHAVELGEYIKAGGAAKCLSLRLFN